MIQKIEYREMCEGDLEQVAALEQASFSMPWSENSIRKSMSDPENIYLVAEDSNTMVGYCGVWVVAGEAQINHVAVRGDYRKQGVASGMLHRLEEMSRSRCLTGITLEVRAGNQAGIALYEKFGFTIAGMRKNFYEKPKEDALIMWKYL